MPKKNFSTIEVKEKKIGSDVTTFLLEITIPTKVFHIGEALQDVGRVEAIETVISDTIEDYYKSIYQSITPEKSQSAKNKKPSKTKKISEPTT